MFTVDLLTTVDLMTTVDLLTTLDLMTTVDLLTTLDLLRVAAASWNSRRSCVIRQIQFFLLMKISSIFFRQPFLILAL
jgi:hypothetical protein